jgi:hypothetical protein
MKELLSEGSLTTHILDGFHETGVSSLSSTINGCSISPPSSCCFSYKIKQNEKRRELSMQDFEATCITTF